MIKISETGKIRSRINEKQIVYIDGIKAIACIGVAYSHFYGTFETSVYPYALPEILVKMYWNNWFVGGMFNGSAWVVVFFVISGFLNSFVVQKIDTLKKWIIYVIRRYLRFAFLVFWGGGLYHYFYFIFLVSIIKR